MTSEEQVRKITEWVNDFDLEDMTRAEFHRELKKLSFNEIEEEMWELYCFVEDVCDILNT